VFVANSHSINRRDFVKVVVGFLGTVMGAIIGLPAIGYLISPATKVSKSDAWIPLGSLEDYPTGVPTPFSFTRSKINGWEKTVNSYGVYVLKTGETEATVFSNMCTHLSCRVTWHEGDQEYVCPCHDGRFDGSGKVSGGPPPEPLFEYETKLEEGILHIHLLEG
jgi:menaquinol-cytochrome c reductase iron-sulfur subunit